MTIVSMLLQVSPLLALSDRFPTCSLRPLRGLCDEFQRCSGETCILSLLLLLLLLLTAWA